MTRTQRQNVFLIMVLAFLAAVGPLSVDTYLPALPRVARHFGVSSGLAQISVTTFFLGLAGGQVVAGPFSDRFGRRPVLFGGFALYLIATIACALSPTMALLIVSRGVQGLAVAVSPAAGRAMVRDLWEGDEAARAMSYMAMGVILAPLIAPTLGGIIVSHWGWRTLFWAMLGFAAVAITVVLRVLPETNGPERRGDMHLRDNYRAYSFVVREPMTWGYLFCGGFARASMFAYITGAPIVYIEMFGVSESHFGLLFALNVAGIFSGTWINSQLVMRYGYHRMLSIGVVLSMIGSLALLTAAAVPFGGLSTIIVCLFLAVSPSVLIGANCNTGLLNLFPRNAGAAGGLMNVAQYGLGTISSLFVGLLFPGSPLSMVVPMGIASVGSCIAMIWLLRVRSRGLSAA